MKFEITSSPEEIAALVAALQERREPKVEYRIDGKKLTPVSRLKSEDGFEIIETGKAGV